MEKLLELAKNKKNILDIRSQHLDAENRLKLPRLYLDIKDVKVLIQNDELTSKQLTNQSTSHANNQSMNLSSNHPLNPISNEQASQPDNEQSKQQASQEQSNPIIIHQPVNQVSIQAVSHVASESINHNTTDIIEQLLIQRPIISNAKPIKRNHLEMSTGLTREETQFLIQHEVKKLHQENEKLNLLRDQRIADLVNKYNSLIIDFKKIKVPKIQNTSVMNLNSNEKKKTKKYVLKCRDKKEEWEDQKSKIIINNFS